MTTSRGGFDEFRQIQAQTDRDVANGLYSVTTQQRILAQAIQAAGLTGASQEMLQPPEKDMSTTTFTPQGRIAPSAEATRATFTRNPKFADINDTQLLEAYMNARITLPEFDNEIVRRGYSSDEKNFMRSGSLLAKDGSRATAATPRVQQSFVYRYPGTVGGQVPEGRQLINGIGVDNTDPVGIGGNYTGSSSGQFQDPFLANDGQGGPLNEGGGGQIGVRQDIKIPDITVIDIEDAFKNKIGVAGTREGAIAELRKIGVENPKLIVDQWVSDLSGGDPFEQAQITGADDRLIGQAAFPRPGFDKWGNPIPTVEPHYVDDPSNPGALIPEPGGPFSREQLYSRQDPSVQRRRLQFGAFGSNLSPTASRTADSITNQFLAQRPLLNFGRDQLSQADAFSGFLADMPTQASLGQARSDFVRAGPGSDFFKQAFADKQGKFNSEAIFLASIQPALAGLTPGIRDNMSRILLDKFRNKRAEQPELYQTPEQNFALLSRFQGFPDPPAAPQTDLFQEFK
jgi:hypothetical protein